MKRLLKKILPIAMLIAFVISATVAVHADDATSNDTNPSEGSSSTTETTETPSPEEVSKAPTAITAKSNSGVEVKGEYIYVSNGMSNADFLNKLEQKSSTEDKYTIDIYKNGTGTDYDTVKTGAFLSIIDSANSPKPRKNYTIILWGDMNGDGYVNTTDADGVVNFLKAESDTSVDKNVYRMAVDYNGNGKIDRDDALKLIGKVNGISSYTAAITDGKSTLDINDESTYTLKLTSSNKMTYFMLDIEYDSSKLTFQSISIDENGWTINKEASSGKIVVSAKIGSGSSDVTLKVSFKATASGSASIKVTNAIGLDGDSNSKCITCIGTSKPVTIGTTKASTPTLSGKTSSSITINTTKNEYYCYSTSSSTPTANSSSWKAASGSTYAFTGLSANTTYYIFHKDSSGNISDYLSVTTDKAETTVSAPSVNKTNSSDTTIAIDLESFDKIYISKSKTTPSSTSDGWAALNTDSGYVYIGSTKIAYTVNDKKKIVSFSGLDNDTTYYFYSMDDSKISSSYYSVTTAPAIKQTSISIDGDAVKLPFSQGYWYSVDATNFRDPSSATSSSSAISLKTSVGETIKLQKTSSSYVTLSGFSKNTSYYIYVKEADSTNHYGIPQEIEIKITSSTSRPSSPVYQDGTCTTVTVNYESGVMYSIDKVRWTDVSYSIYPTEDDPETLGSYGYYFDHYLNPTKITFTNLDPGSDYKTFVIYASYSNSSLTSQLSIILQHKWGAAYNKVEATETTDGSYKHQCSDCRKVETVTVPATGCKHTETTSATVDSTCTSEGYTVVSCKKCGKEISKTTIAKKNHTLTTETVNPTCIADGYTRTYCTVCKAETSRVAISKIAHSYTDVTIPSTCSSHGAIQHKCSSCGYIEYATELPLLEHQYEWVTTIEPTSSTMGLKIHKCSVCSNIDEEQTIPKLVNKVTNADGSITYEVSAESTLGALSEAAKEAAANGGNVKVIFADGSYVVFDKSISASLSGDSATLELVKIKDAASASGNITAAGFDVNSSSVYEISLNGIVVIGDLKATVTVPYEMPPVSGIEPRVYYVDVLGNKTKIKNVTYDAVAGTITFNAEHFSTYVVTNETAKSGGGSGATIAIITIVAVLLALGGTFGYIVYTSNNTKKKKFRF